MHWSVLFFPHCSAARDNILVNMSRYLIGKVTASTLILLFLSLPLAVQAGQQANAMCQPVIPACPCGTVPSQSVCIAGTNWFMCPDHCIDVEPGGTVYGQCVAPNDCKATHAVDINGNAVPLVNPAANPSVLGQVGTFLKGNPLIGGLAIGAGMSLITTGLGALLAPKTGSSGSGTNYTPGACTTQYYYTSDPNALVDPCAVYNPSSPTNPTIPTSCPIVISPFCLNGTLIQQPNDANNCPVAPKCVTSTATSNVQSTADILSISPTTGVPPLAVTANFTSGASCGDAYDLSWGDGTPDFTMTYAPPAFGSACGQVALINKPTHTYTAAGTYTPTLQSGTNLQFTSTVTVSVTAPSTGNTGTVGLTATPTSGTAPLAVQFTGGVMGTRLLLTLGDGSTPLATTINITCPASNSNCANTVFNPLNYSYTYTQSGTYQATLQDSSNITQGTVTITVLAPATSTTSSSLGDTAVPISTILSSTVYYGDTTSSSTPTPSQTPLSQNATPAPGQGLNGNLLSAGGGATVYATSVTGNTEVSGFYGSNSAPAQLCQSRPWSSNFLSYIIPPTFFDNICSWAGFPTGPQQSSVVSSGGSGGSQSVSVAPPQQSKPQYTGGVHATATIWARPPSVSLGGRTNIFWISQDVSSCTESSSDGNFSGSSTSGGASTVALSGPVTFTITCLSLDGTSISNSTTVTIGS